MDNIAKMTCVALGLTTAGVLLTLNMPPVGSNIVEKSGFVLSVAGMVMLSAIYGYTYNKNTGT